jgi:hypothetical protein
MRGRKYLSKANLCKAGYVLLLSLPVVVFLFRFSLLYRHGIFQGEDWDYFAQNYEAARQSILHYHQFPWWNPWMNGGQPLFGNPQFGLISIQMPLVLIFGTVVGLHYSLLAYFLLGFWGMYLLLQRIDSNSRLLSALLSYIWLFSGFNTWHLAGGHLTFAVYLLAPWVFLSLLNIHKRLGWLWLGLSTSLIINSAAHYLTFETLFIVAVIGIIQIIRISCHKHLKTLKTIWPILRPYVYAVGIIALLSVARLWYTLQFLNDYPRLQELDPPESLKLFIASITFRHDADPSTLTHFTTAGYSWIEYTGYFGLTALALFIYLVIRRFESVKSILYKDWLLLAGIALSALISLGAFSKFSPFNILHSLPVFSQMRVPSRFICWFVFGIILFLIRLPRKPIIYVLLVIAALDVFAANYFVVNYPQKRYMQTTNLSRPFEQYEFYQTDPGLGHLGVLSLQNLRLLRVTQNNGGEIYGYEPVLNTGEYYYLPGTTRCGIKQGCHFVITKNAEITYWSPQRIELRRTGSGSIKLNMNPGNVWLVNSKDLFKNYKVLELRKDFIINDPTKVITVTFKPGAR